MTENKDNLRAGTVEGLIFFGRESWAFLAEKCHGVEKSGVASQSAGRIAC
jgi:hypothetical protein